LYDEQQQSAKIGLSNVRLKSKTQDLCCYSAKTIFLLLIYIFQSKYKKAREPALVKAQLRHTPFGKRYGLALYTGITWT